jgi:hypothetical protein
MEALRFQTDKRAYKELVGYFGMLRNSAGDPVDTFVSVVLPCVVKCLRDHYNASVNIRLVHDKPNEYTMAVVPPMFTEKHPLVTRVGTNMSSGKANAGVLKELLSNPDKILGFGVDYETGKLTGFAAQLEIPFYVGESMLRDGMLTPEWLANMVIHEMGHVITYFLSLRYQTSTAWAIRYAIEQLDGSNGDEEFLVSVEKAYGVTAQADVERLGKLDDRSKKDRVTLIILDKVRAKTRAELGTTFADRSSAEALADQFVVRHGDAVEYAKCIEYFARQDRPDNTMGLVAGATATALGALILGPVLAAAAVGVALVATMMVLGNAEAGIGYDKPYDRAVRVRNDLVAALKTAESAEVRNQLVVDINAFDKLLPVIKEHEPILGKALAFFSPSLRNLRREQNLVATLETLFNNPMYVRQAQLAQFAEL